MRYMNKGNPGNAEDVNAVLGKALKRLRTAAGVNQTELSRRLDVDQTAISRWELGRDIIAAYRIPQIEDALDQPRGALWAEAGLVELNPVEAAIYADSGLEVNQQSTLAAVYQSLKGQRGGSGRRPT